jgi:hypothetical protein
MKKTFFFWVKLLFLACAIFISCKKNVSVDPRISSGKQKSPHVYVAVSRYSPPGDRYNKGEYWKDDSVFSLSNCSNAFSIAVSGNDVFVSGVDAQTGRLAYWKNGIEVDLPYDIPYTKYPYTNHSISAGKLVVSGTDVYQPITELKYNSNTDEDTFSVAAYGKNNIKVLLSNSLIYNAASSIAISDKGIYVTGTGNDINYSHSRAEYWINGTPVYLSDSSMEGAGAQDIAISGNDVYILGTEEVIGSNGGGVPRIVYWKNGDRVVITDGTHPDFPHSIAVSGSDVYIAGTDIHQLNPQSSLSKFTAMYWKNGSPVILSNSLFDSEANSIAVYGQDVYVAGFEKDGAGTRIAKYWKNGIPVILSNSPYDSEAFSICLSK